MYGRGRGDSCNPREIRYSLGAQDYSAEMSPKKRAYGSILCVKKKRWGLSLGLASVIPRFQSDATVVILKDQ